MRRTLTTIRCVPRYGYADTEVRTVDLELADPSDHEEVQRAMERWFGDRGLADAVYDVDWDDSGVFVIINDEAYSAEWGARLL